jgi:hypothetical protein
MLSKKRKNMKRSRVVKVRTSRISIEKRKRVNDFRAGRTVHAAIKQTG